MHGPTTNEPIACQNQVILTTLRVKIARRKKWAWIGIFKAAEPHSPWDVCSLSKPKDATSSVNDDAVSCIQIPTTTLAMQWTGKRTPFLFDTLLHPKENGANFSLIMHYMQMYLKRQDDNNVLLYTRGYADTYALSKAVSLAVWTLWAHCIVARVPQA